jgi:SAM-dependent methyltransferase
MTYFDHFASASSTVLGRWITKRTVQREFQLIRPFLNNSSIAILEIGPGIGDLAEAFRAAGFGNYTVVEPSPSMRAAMIRKGFNASRDYLIPKLEEEDAAFDLIILCDVFEHLNDTRDAQMFLSEAQRVLKPNGALCFLLPDFLHWQSDFFNADYTHSNISTVRRLMQLFFNHGFAVKRWLYLSAFVTGWRATLLSWLIRCALKFAKGNGMNCRLYKLKLTFLRRFLIIGAKVDRD